MMSAQTPARSWMDMGEVRHYDELLKQIVQEASRVHDLLALTPQFDPPFDQRQEDNQGCPVQP